MALVSILLSVVALVCTAVGFFTTPIPVLGTLFSFGAAALALLGVVLAGRATTAATRQGTSNDTARIGKILNVLALVPALLVALTCGVCNALFSTGNVQVQRDFQFNTGQGWGPDAGPNAMPPPAQAVPGEPVPGTPPNPGSPVPPAGPALGQPARPGEPGQPPVQPGPGAPPQQVAPSLSNLPPPPLPAGPSSP